MVRSRVLLAICVAFVLACGCAASKKDQAQKTSDGFLSAENWKAWVNRQPPGPPRLIVTGDVMVSATNYEPVLTFQSLDRSLPPGLNLRLTVRRTDDAGGGMVVKKQARYENTEHTNVDRVSIRYPDGKSHTIRENETAE